MKNFLKKSIAYLLAFALLAIVAEISCQKLQSDDYAWGNHLYRAKLQAVRDSADFNTFFLGSSHFHRHIDPVQFDSLNAQRGISTKSYNLGVPGLTNPENYFLLEKMLADPTLRPRNVFIILQQLAMIDPGNFFKPRTCYSLDGSSMPQIFGQIETSAAQPTKAQLRRKGTYFLNFAYRFVGLPRLRRLFYEKNEPLDLSEMRRGFLPLESEITEENLQRNTEFLADTSKLAAREAKARIEFSAADPDKFLNRNHLKQLLRLHQLAEKQGVRLFFVLSPRMEDFREIVPFRKNLPAESVVDLADPSLFPQFYKVENSFDLGHLNTRGAEIFTAELAKIFQKNSSVKN